MPWVSSQALQNLDPQKWNKKSYGVHVVHTCILSSWETEAGRLRLPGQPGLHGALLEGKGEEERKGWGSGGLFSANVTYQLGPSRTNIWSNIRVFTRNASTYESTDSKRPSGELDIKELSHTSAVGPMYSETCYTHFVFQEAESCHSEIMSPRRKCHQSLGRQWVSCHGWLCFPIWLHSRRILSTIPECSQGRNY